jgi:putative transposase
MESYVSHKLTLKGPHTKEDFLKLYKKCKDSRLKERYQAMYLSFKYSWEEIAEIVGRDYQTILEWARLYNEYGLEGLRLGKPPGRPSSLSDDQLGELKRTVQAHPRKLDLPFSNWSLKSVIKWVKDGFGVVFSKEGIRKVLHKLGFVCIKPSYVFILANRKKQKSFIRKLKRRLEKGKTLLFEDESIAQQHPTLHKMWALKGKRPSIPTLGNHSKKKVFGVVNPFTGNTLHKIVKKLSSDEFITFMDNIKAHYKGYRIVLVLDNFPTHKSKKVKEYVKENSHWLEVLFLPAYSPQFNPIEQLWKRMKYVVTHNTFYMRIEELGNSIDEFFAEIKVKKSVVKSICSAGYLVDGD